MPLVTSRDFNLTPDISPLTKQISAAVQRSREEDKLAQKASAEKAQQAVKTAGAQALRVRGIKDFSTQRKEMAIMAQKAIGRGEDPQQFVDALNIQNQDEFNLNLTRIATAAGNADKMLSEGLKQQEQFEPVTDEQGNIVAQRNVQTGEVIKDPRAKKGGAGGGVSEVQSSKILPGGLVQIVRKDGTTEVIPAKKAGQILVKDAEKRGAELQGLRAGERGAAAESQKLAVVAFKKLAPIQKSIRNIERAITLVDEGAKTGVIQSKMPSIRQASIELDNVQAQMGLDVIGSTTFGALSESELAFALSAALPKNLKGPALRDWLTRKRDAQRKLSDYITEAAIFMGTPGNTMSGFLRDKKQQFQSKENVVAEQVAPSEVAAPPVAQAQPQPKAAIKFLGFE